MSPRSLAYRAYEWWLRRRLADAELPHHVALIMDGNRRWARQMGHADPSVGHRHGAEHLREVLGWCRELGIRHVTVWVASADNIRKRASSEVSFLMHLSETTIARELSRDRQWRIHLAGRLDLLPDSTVHALKDAQDATRDVEAGGDLTIAIGYGGREEIVMAVRSLLDEAALHGRRLDDVAASLAEGDIARYLDARDLPYPDLVIRTSGEQRLSDFMLWQGVNADLSFVDTYWPAFRRVDLLRLLRQYAARHGGTARK